MRNWNIFSTSPFWIASRFSFYLWGIETNTRLRWLAKQMSFHSTYEELKPGMLAEWMKKSPAFSFYLWGIETVYFVRQNRNKIRFHSTYEELKPRIFRLEFFPILAGFHSTYEELKPNPRPLMQLEITSFSFYLWGIETIENNRNHINDKSFSFYLWGIETYIINNNILQVKKVFILPMRNWNATFFSVASKAARFSFYLWGIETFSVFFGLFLCFWFSFYLWGIETLMQM